MIEIHSLLPNNILEALYSYVGCALSENIEEAQNAFQRCCPSMFKIIGIYGQKSENKLRCRWIVQYCLAENKNSTETEEICKTYLNLIGRYSPCDTKMIDCVVSDVVTICFGVLCQCGPSFFATFTEPPKHQIVGTDEDILGEKLWSIAVSHFVKQIV